jgi:hypothetical protein
MLALVACLLGLVAGALPRSAHADWRSLTGPLPAFTSRVDFKLSPDSRVVAYVADGDADDADDVDELYVAPVGGSLRKLNPPLVAGGDINRFRFVFTPDSSQILYLADQEVDERVELFSVPVEGGPARRLNAPLVVGGNVTDFQLAAKNGRVVYAADGETNDVVELWSIALSGGGLQKLNGPLTQGGDIGLFELDPLSNRVVYSADQEVDGRFELFSAPVLGGSSTRLNMPITLGGGGDSGIYSEWAVNPVVPVVVFQARNDGLKKNLFAVPTAGGVPHWQLNFKLLPEQRILNFQVSPAGDRVVFNVGANANNTNAFKGNLYSTLIGGGGNADLTEKADPLYGVGSFTFTPDGKRVVYMYQKNASAYPRLEAAGVASGVTTPLYEPGPSDPPLVFFRLSGDSQWAAVFASAGGPPYDLAAVPINGGNPVRFGPVINTVIAPDSGRIFVVAPSEQVTSSELFSEQLFGGGRRNLSGLRGAGSVGGVAVSGDSKAVVFVVQVDKRYDLRISDGIAAQPSPTPAQTPAPTPAGNRVYVPVVRR